MNNLFLTREQASLLTYEECQQRLKAITKQYAVDKPLMPRISEIWPILDDIVDTILYLEDRIKGYEDPRIPSMDPTASDVPIPAAKPAPPKPTGPKQVRRRRKFRVGDVIYLSVMDASEKLGLKEHTLRNYVTRDPKKYGYLD
jgi:hypothetical protein